MPQTRLDLTGQVFGRLTVTGEAPRGKPNRNGKSPRRWFCSCTCGNTSIISTGSLRCGKTNSCGCLKHESWNRKHGYALRDHQDRIPEYHIWKQMRQRCNNLNSQDYPDYGGRGIFVCPEWDSFERFLADMGRRPSSGHSIDRINRDGPYSPDNCHWATQEEQANNKKSNIVLTFDGKTMSLLEWAEVLGFKPHALYGRYYRGWDAQRILTTPHRGW